MFFFIGIFLEYLDANKTKKGWKILGQQQLLMIVLALIIVAIAIAISIQLFRSNAIESKRDIVINECTNLATIAISYYKKPIEIGGGGRTFIGWVVPNSLVTTVNGSYLAEVNIDHVVITGTGTEVVTGNDSIKVETTVTAEAINSIIIN